ncbi:MAG: ANTAR domain-containing protein [Umezawaea sp.]
MATIGILHQRIVHRHELVTEQLQYALNSRILAERLHVSVDHAFSAMRTHARATNSKILDIAASVLAGALIIEVPMSD